jgi:hypothetical protein
MKKAADGHTATLSSIYGKNAVIAVMYSFLRLE